MAVSFKFRSSARFDSVAIDGGRPSISLRDLKSKIARCKNLDTCHDFDLVLSDAVSGLEYRDEDCQIPSGSSVIIKRVPAGTAQPDVARITSQENAEKEDRTMHKSSPPTNVPVENFDDFGEELCPMLEATVSGSTFDGDKRIKIDGEKMNAEVPRYLEKPSVGCIERLPHDLHRAPPGGLMPAGDENKFELKSKPCVGKLDDVITRIPEVLQDSELPAELKCSLCDTIFKEAVMIPCCQHSFCERCIQRLLIQNGRCPKCFSPKPRVEDLLPNVSLRQAIDRFLSSQIIAQGSDNALDQYAPDEESAIHAKETSYGVSVCQRQESPDANDRGSNQVIAEPGGQMHGLGPPVNLKRQNEDFVPEFQGESQPMHEVESRFTRKRPFWVNNAGGERSSTETDWYKKRVRACYTCGSPNHLMRDCPDALSAHPRFQTGAMPKYPSPLWNGISYSQFCHFGGGPYANPGFNSYHAAMLPPTAFTVPNQVPPMFGLMPAYSGITSMGGAPVPAAGPQWGQGCFQFMEPQCHDKRLKSSIDDLRREQSRCIAEDKVLNNKHHYDQAEKANNCNLDKVCDGSAGFSDDGQRSHKKRQLRSYMDDETIRSGSDVENMPHSSKWHGENRHRSQHGNDEKHNHPREQAGSDSSHGKSRRISSNDKDVKRKQAHSDSGREQRKHHSHSNCVLESSYKEKESSHGSRHSRHNSRSVNNELGYERWQMVSGSEDDGDRDHLYYNRFENS